MRKPFLCLRASTFCAAAGGKLIWARLTKRLFVVFSGYIYIYIFFLLA